ARRSGKVGPTSAPPDRDVKEGVSHGSSTSKRRQSMLPQCSGRVGEKSVNRCALNRPAICAGTVSGNACRAAARGLPARDHHREVLAVTKVQAPWFAHVG